jgi:hypothetical protein
MRDEYFLNSSGDSFWQLLKISIANHQSWSENVAPWGGNFPLDFSFA